MTHHNPPSLQSVTDVGNTTTNATSFQDTATFSKTSATDAPVVADQGSVLGPAFSIRTLGAEYLTARVQNVGVIFAGLIGSFPAGVTWTGYLTSALTGGFTVDAASNFTMFGGGSFGIRGRSVTNGVEVDTSLQGFGVNLPRIQTLFTNNAGRIQVPDPIAATWTLATREATETLQNKTLTTPSIASFVNANHDHTNAAGGGQLDHTTALTNIGTNTHAQIDTHIASDQRHSWPIGIWNARNIATTLTDQNTTFGALTPGVYIFEVAGKALGMVAELDQVVTGGGSLTLTLFKNGASTGKTIVFTAADPVRKTTTFGTPETFAAGDRADIKWTTSAAFTPNGVIDFNVIVRGVFD